MHAPVVIQVPFQDDPLKTALLKKKPSSERTLRTRHSSMSKTESSGSSSDTPTNEECDSCRGNGNLTVCDGCYGAYHSECFNPSSPTDLYCLECTASMNHSKGTSSPSSGIEVIEADLPSSPKAKPKVSEKEPAVRSPKRRRGKQPIKLCEVCDQLGELVACVVCAKSYHTYCVDLVHPIAHFKCADHENVELIPREMFPLHFTPEKWRDDASTQIDDDKDTTLNSAKRSKLNAEEEDVPDLLLMLRNSSSDVSDEISPSILKNFSPKFIEFLAWQQLKEIHKKRSQHRRESDAKF
eukprot:TRINITY_DN9416_c0_g1_i1.p1 TRINITY_DN9416_c0_g1~~TRINITY_DN9416_c0_g1_i1.p1  ORF type:complete len:296 (-),score=47.70 TRINITY_DN9416_c0_g1_i1:62-949(-)